MRSDYGTKNHNEWTLFKEDAVIIEKVVNLLWLYHIFPIGVLQQIIIQQE